MGLEATRGDRDLVVKSQGHFRKGHIPSKRGVLRTDRRQNSRPGRLRAMGYLWG